jgi:hypothetical protein
VDGRQQLVATAGVGLVAVNFWTSNQRAAVGGTVWSKKDPTKAHTALLAIGGELLLVAILTFAGGTSDTAANASLAVLAALWILWAMKHYGSTGGAASTTSSAPMQQAPKIQGA